MENSILVLHDTCTVNMRFVIGIGRLDKTIISGSYKPKFSYVTGFGKDEICTFFTKCNILRRHKAAGLQFSMNL